MENISEHIKAILSTLPEGPGVYMHLNEDGTIIYVGKAKNLKKRVSSYFQKEHDNYKTRQLVKNIADIKYIVVESEQDAFLLENNLIKQYQPYYNILLKDGKSYPSICITKEDYPRVYKTRKIDKKAGEYYGPYSYGNTVDLVLELIHELYPIRTCQTQISKSRAENNKYKICLKYHLHKCCGICEQKISDENYEEYINQIRKIIKGNAHEISKKIYDDMQEHAAKLEFEKAQELKRKYELIEKFRSRTVITNTNIRDTEVYGYYAQDDEVFVSMLKINNGSIIKSDIINYKNTTVTQQEEILSTAISEIREKNDSSSRNIIVPFTPDFIDENWNIITPQYGEKKQLLYLANNNAEQAYKDKLKQSDKLNPDQRATRILTKLQEKLKLPKLPVFIDSFDNSNIQGTSAVAGCVVFKMGKPSKKDYKKFDIKTVSGQDDYASMREVAFRRYKRIIDENGELPQLVIADGGVGQMHALQEVIEKELGLDIAIAGLKKDNKHRTSTLLYGFPPKEIQLKTNDELFFFLTQIQDEVHRFAISFHRNKRSKSQTRSELDDIKGIGEKSKQALLKKFKSVSRLKDANLDAIEEIVGKSRAAIVYKHFHD